MSERILVTGARAPAALDIARSLKAAGFEVHMADCVPARISRWSTAPVAVHRHASPVQEPAPFADDIRRLLDRLNPVAVIPTCEEVFYLSALAQTDGWSHRLIAPLPEQLTRLHHKGHFADLCRTLGLPVPETAIVTDTASLMAHAGDEDGDVVVKAAWSRFGARTLVSPTASQLVTVRPSAEQPWIVQGRVRGEELSLYAIAQDGQLAAFCAYRSQWRVSGGAAYVFEPLEGLILKQLGHMAERLAVFVGTGQFACDAIVDSEGRPWLIECNPRATSGVHLFERSAALGHALLGRGVAEPVSGRARNGVMFNTFGIAAAMRRRRLSAWYKELGRSHDILSARGDPLPTLGALADATGFGLRALDSRCSLAEAMTSDIEWNGQALTPGLWETP